MKHFQTQYRNETSFSEWLEAIRESVDSNDLQGNTVLFHIYTDSRETRYVDPVIHMIREWFPRATYAGCSGNGGIIDGRSAAEHVIVAASVFEDPDTKAEAIQLPVTYESQEDSAQRLMEAVRARPWVKAIEMMTTIGNTDMPSLCEKISAIDKEIQLFGGGALATDVHDGNSGETFVFSSAGELTRGGAVFVLLGGDQVHIRTAFMTGWRELGLPFDATDTERNVLKTLNDQPALDVYCHFTGIPRDEHFFDISVVFPLCFKTEGVPQLRVAPAFTEDGAMILGADVSKHTQTSIAYGDPSVILNSVNRTILDFQDFAPDAIQLYSCAGRQFYWGEEVDNETMPFQNIAPTLGFYTSGELLRSKGNVLLHNLTIVIAAIREGDAKAGEKKEIPMMKEAFSRQILINKSLTTFINAATEQLVEANERLQNMAITDGLTQLCTRGETERRIRMEMRKYLAGKEDRTAPILMMIDLDHFKNVNDTFGHQAGDEVLRHLADMFRDVLKEKELGTATVGRWGGEEFMFLLPGMAPEEAADLAEEIRARFADYVFPASGAQTLSAGLTRAEEADTADSLISRVDRALYTAKERGRNCCVSL